MKTNVLQKIKEAERETRLAKRMLKLNIGIPSWLFRRNTLLRTNTEDTNWIFYRIWEIQDIRNALKQAAMESRKEEACWIK